MCVWCVCVVFWFSRSLKNCFGGNDASAYCSNKNPTEGGGGGGKKEGKDKTKKK